MKYGLIVHNYGTQANKYKGFNIGDPIQTIALEKLYYEMGIIQNDIIKIDMCDLTIYNGEYVLLPMLGVAIGIGFCPLPISPKIIPVFISAHFAINELSSEIQTYLREYAPIGCRDEYSLQTMRKYGIPAYLSGCITTIFNKRIFEPDKKKIYLIDIPSKLEKYLPEDIKNNAIKETHLLPLEKKDMTHSAAEKFAEIARNRLNEYKTNASLIVSSRMHALVPCMAMGIPIIAVFDNISYRFSWLDKYIFLYTEEEFQNINWEPPIIDYESEKIKIKEMFKQIIYAQYNKFCRQYKISEFYENRNRAIYGNKYINAIKSIEFEKKDFEYIIWGCGLIGNSVFEIIQKIYPNAKLVAAVDEYVSGVWHNAIIIKSDKLADYPQCYIFIATYSGREQGYKTMELLGKKEFKDYLYLGTING